jgi:hypothetical protein
VALVITYVSEERISSIIRVKRISELQFLVTANVFLTSLIFPTLMMEAIRYSETPVITRPTRYHILEDGILHVR